MALFTTCSGSEAYKDAFMERCTPKTGPMVTTNLTPECYAEYVKMYTQFGKLGCTATAPAPTASTATATAPAPTASAATAKCVNTPGWTNGDAYKHPCANYAKVWCDAGKARAGSEWTLGAKWNFPEKNCCVCGKAAADAKAAKAKAKAAAAAAAAAKAKKAADLLKALRAKLAGLTKKASKGAEFANEAAAFRFVGGVDLKKAK